MKKLLIVLFLITLSFVALASEETILELQMFYNDNTLKFKDIVDALESEGDILLPLNQLSSILKFDLSLDKSLNQFEVIEPENKLPFKLDAAGYLNMPELIEKKPVILNSEIYVHRQFFESFLNIKTSYDSAALVVSFYLNDPSPLVIQNNLRSPENSEEDDLDIIEAPAKLGALSSLEYKLAQTFRNNLTQTKGEMYLHFKLGKAELTTGLSFSSKNWHEFLLRYPFVRLRLENNFALLIIGNNNITSETCLKEQAFFGLSYQAPYPAKFDTNSYSIPYKITGDSGEKVTVLVNEQPIKTVTLPKEGYLNEKIQLRPYRLQEIAIKRSNAETTETIMLSNGLQLVPPKIVQLNFYYGLYGKDPSNWQGELLELNINAGLNAKNTLNTLLVWQAPLFKLKNPSLRVRLLSELFPGISIRPTLYLTFNDKPGSEFDLICSLNNMHWELGYFNLPANIKQYWNKRGEHGLNFLAEADISSHLSWQGEALAQLKTKITPLLRLYSTQLNYSLPKQHSKFVVGYNHNETYILEFSKIMTSNTGSLAYSSKNHSYSLSSGYSISRYSLNNLFWVNQSLENKATFKVGSNSAFSLESYLQAEKKTSLIGIFNGAFQLDFKKFFFLSSSTAQATIKPETRLESWEIGLSASNKTNPRLSFEIKRNQGDLKGNYWLNILGLSYHWPKNNLRLTLNFKKELDELIESSWKFSWNSNYQNGISTSLSFERLPLVYNSVKPEYLAAITISQGIAFTPRGLLGRIYKGETISSTVSGVVFLDLNNNGKQDSNELGLKDIEMKLNSMVVASKADGSFIFANVDKGIHQFGFNPKKLDSNYTTTLINFPIKINTGDNLSFEMPLTMNGVLQGRIFIDVDGDGIFSKGDTALDWVQVKLVENSQKTFSDKDGFYYFENLPLGKFTVTVDAKTLPLGLNSPKPIEIYITPEELDAVYNLPLRY